jgi:hypothetical protein
MLVHGHRLLARGLPAFFAGKRSKGMKGGEIAVAIIKCEQSAWRS